MNHPVVSGAHFAVFAAPTLLRSFLYSRMCTGFALGTLDTDPEIKIERHVFTKYKAPWHVITDDLPQIEELSDMELHEAKNKN